MGNGQTCCGQFPIDGRSGHMLGGKKSIYYFSSIVNGDNQLMLSGRKDVSEFSLDICLHDPVTGGKNWDADTDENWTQVLRFESGIFSFFSKGMDEVAFMSKLKDACMRFGVKVTELEDPSFPCSRSRRMWSRLKSRRMRPPRPARRSMRLMIPPWRRERPPSGRTHAQEVLSSLISSRPKA